MDGSRKINVDGQTLWEMGPLFFMDERPEVQRTVGIIKACDLGSLSLMPGTSPTFGIGYGGRSFLKAAYITLLSA